MTKIFCVFSVALAASLFGFTALAQEPNHRLLAVDDGPDYSRRLEYHRAPRPGKAGPQQTTLFARQTHPGEPGYGRSAFNFNGIRSDGKDWLLVARNRAHLTYGNLSIDQDPDYFVLLFGGDDNLSRIKDLGEKQWKDVTTTPNFPLARHLNGPRIPNNHEPIESSSDGRITKVVAGHLYLVHFKDEQEEFYAMFRVDSLAPSNRCTISWQVVPPPKQ
jgi:hypothetical protein